MTSLKFLQINLNRSRAAHDLTLQTAQDMKADIILLSEPNRRAIKDRKDWIYDNEQNAAIKVLSTIPVKTRGSGPGFAFVTIPNLTVYSIYSSGNNDIQLLDNTLHSIERRIHSRKENAIVAGDFNAKSPQWGMDFTDRRGQIVTEWMAANNLIIANQGDAPTFQIQGYTSILDLTISTENIASRIVNWQVIDKETLSDHNYIAFEVMLDRDVTQTPRRQHGWHSRNLDEGKLHSAIKRIDHTKTGTTPIEFRETLTRICDIAIPKKKSFPNRKPAYWWNQEIAGLRKISNQRRRMYMRTAKRNLPLLTEQMWRVYRESKKELRNAIKNAKRDSWKKLCNDVDQDIWGDGYKLVMKMMNGFPPVQKLSIEDMEIVVRHLFPTHKEVNFVCDSGERFPNFKEEELKLASSKLKSKKAPGPGLIPSEVVKYLATHHADYTLSIYNKLALAKQFPEEWKLAKLVLIKKADKSTDDPSAYRPICLLDAEGKLYEQLISLRLKSELERTGGLSDKQFGFREGRQTVDALMEVIKIARRAEAFTSQHRRMCAVITLDVKNAFNSAPWQMILERLSQKNISSGLIGLIRSYLSRRRVLLEVDDTTKEIEINSGVPQGSVLGPTLWNVLYDDLLRLEYPEGVSVIGFADDIALVATDKNERILMDKVNAGLLIIARWMRQNLLELAPQKTEAIILTKKRKIPQISFNLLGNTIRPQNAIKYLGMWLDPKLTFAEHVNQIIKKAERTTAALAKLMPNMGGPRASKRKLLVSVIHSQLLYAAPVWHTITSSKKILAKLNRVQRKLCIRTCSGYRTISAVAAEVIAGIPPIKLLIIERNESYEGKSKKDARITLLDRWQEAWRTAVYGRWTWTIIPDIKTWLERAAGEVDYFLTQALSGHGCFRKYLHGRNRAESPECFYCKEEDDVEHTLFKCSEWREERQRYFQKTGKVFTVENLRTGLVSNQDDWNAIYSTVRAIIERKEKEWRN